MLSNRLPVTDQGVTIPKVWFGDATQVELRKDQGVVVVQPLDVVPEPPPTVGPVPPDDPLWRLCENLSDIDVTDASMNLDKYLYGIDP